MLNEFYRIAFRKKIYDSIVTLQTDLYAWHDQYNNEREHQGRWCYGKTPMRTFLDSLELGQWPERLQTDGRGVLPVHVGVPSRNGFLRTLRLRGP